MVIACLLMDRLLGEPKQYHPLVGFGRCTGWLEAKLNSGKVSSKRRYLRGCYGWMILVLPIPFFIQVLLTFWPSGSVWISLLCLYFAIGWQSLTVHGRAVADALSEGNLVQARAKVSYLVSRDTQLMAESDISRATIESVLENGSDAIFAPLFWFLVAGPAGAVAYRLANTLDAMWGYRTQRFTAFGWCSARVDDLLNYFPARLTALSYALSGKPLKALGCWRKQASSCHSPNGGPVMCSGAGALQVQLGGGAYYHGVWRDSPEMGEGGIATQKHISSALTLINKSICLWILVLAVLELFIRQGIFF